MTKRKNTALYILAAVILVVSARYIQVRTGNFLSARQARLEAYANRPLHELTFLANDIYYIGQDFIATVQVADLYGYPLSAKLTVSLYHADSEITSQAYFATCDYGHATVKFPLSCEIRPGTAQHQLLIHVESGLGAEYFEKIIRISPETAENFIINFDKGLYNPGDDVLFRILALYSTSARPLAGRQFDISIFDGNDNRVFSQPATASDFGIISGRFSLADEVNSGMYRLTVEEYGREVAEAHFEVMPFVLPRFEIALQTCQTEYQVGDTIYITGEVMYFFGEPVNQGVVSVYVNGRPQLVRYQLGEYGEFFLSYIVHTAGSFEIFVEVIDNSNFRVETFTTVRAAEGVFGIEILPEFGYLVMGLPNVVYIFTHTAGGEPVRTFLQVTGRNFSRQVATCDNGIGRFILEDVQNTNHISVYALDMDGNREEKRITLSGYAHNITLRTNQPRFAMGETIYLELNTREQSGKFQIFAYRNDRLLQMVETTLDRAQLNLGDAFGIIDIYAVWVPDGNIRPVETLPHARRTVFIDPGRYMQLNVASDRPEYRPGEFVSLSFDVADNHGSPLDAALLVSIVDQAMLSLAANDLSICNIRLALEDISFGADLDAATLYLSLVGGASEQAITRLLMRQENTSTFMRTVTTVNPPPYVPQPSLGYRLMQGFFNFLRGTVVLFCAIAFVIIARRKMHMVPVVVEKTDKHDAHDILSAPVHSYKYVPYEETEEEQQGKRRAVWVVASSITLFILAMLFLTSCSGGNDDDAPAATAPAPAGGIFQREPQAPVATAAPPRPVGTQPPAGNNLLPTETPQELTQEPPREIETQTARVRRLFLETMLFVPELVATNGQSDLAFMLADNITTWNIQVVGNTKDGLVGHTQSSIRAFQPFFVDFELPRNSIRHDQVSIPVTVFNYTEYDQSVIITIAEMPWFTLHGEAIQTITVPQGRSVMVYVPITITEFGNFVFRVYADAFNIAADTNGGFQQNHFADAAERPISINPEGFRIRQVVSSGSIETSTWQHLLFMQDDIPDTRNAFITFYPSIMSTVVEGMENIFRMPFGCFEQTSSILYPNILALRYMQQNNISNPALTERALRYISSGYQRLLTFEVRGEPGGFSLFGHTPAETVLTAYGLMMLNALTCVYTIDERVMDRMADFLFRNQNPNGTFEITGRRNVQATQRLAFNAYIAWALSEVFPDDTRLARSVDYLVSQLNNVDDNYTLALIANVLVNTGHARATEVVNRLAANIITVGDTAYVTSGTRDYFGAFGRMQYLQATALTSIALSNHGSHANANERLVNYIIGRRDSWGTWHSTQATILSLKALTTHTPASPLQDGQITVTIGNQTRTIDISSANTLDMYQVAFTGLERENIVDIRFPDLGRMTYKIVIEYFAPYDSVELNRGFEISSKMNTSLAVHELVHQEIRIINTSGDIVKNGLVAISIPQGFRVERNSLALMQHAGIIQRYEMRHDNINLYLRDTEPGEIIDLIIAYRPAFPVRVTGGHVRVFDYYNPMVEGYLKPVEIVVVE